MKCFKGKANRRFCFCAISLVLMALMVSLPGWAQTNTGRLVGTVYDAAEAVVPGAAIVVTDTLTNKERTLTSDETGSFITPLLDIGTYTVKVSKEGFKTYTATDVVIQVGREYALRIQLEVGAPSTVVEVSEGISLVTATSGELSTTITSKQIQELPLDARNPLTLMLTLPGSSSNSAQNTSINGQRTAWTNITRDGINIQDAFIRSNATDFAPGRPSTDDTEEITLSTQNAGADVGNGGAQIRLVTPRGSSTYHGSLWEYNRNSAYAANTFFNNRSGTPLPFRNRNNFGGRVAGKVPPPAGEVDVMIRPERLQLLAAGETAGNDNVFEMTLDDTINYGDCVVAIGKTHGLPLRARLVGSGAETLQPGAALRLAWAPADAVRSCDVAHVGGGGILLLESGGCWKALGKQYRFLSFYDTSACASRKTEAATAREGLFTGGR